MWTPGEPWRVVESLRTLHTQLRPLAPGVPASAFGTIADDAHLSSSDHYPHYYSALGTVAVVCAKDFPDAELLDPWVVLEAIRVSRDPRVKYGISRGQMFSSYATSSYPAWVWRPYGGADGHFTHGHLSVVGDAGADGTQPFKIGADMGDFTIAGELASAYLPRVERALWWPIPGIARDVAALKAAVAADEVRDRALQAAIEGLTVGGSVEAAPIITAIEAVRDEARVEFGKLHLEVAEQRARADAAEARAEQLAAALATAGAALQTADDAPTG